MSLWVLVSLQSKAFGGLQQLSKRFVDGGCSSFPVPALTLAEHDFSQQI